MVILLTRNRHLSRLAIVFIPRCRDMGEPQCQQGRPFITGTIVPHPRVDHVSDSIT